MPKLVKDLLEAGQEDVFLVIQEGGTSQELYLSAYDTLDNAKEFRSSCAGAAYRTTPPIKFPLKAFDVPEVQEALEDLIRSILELDYPPEVQE